MPARKSAANSLRGSFPEELTYRDYRATETYNITRNSTMKVDKLTGKWTLVTGAGSGIGQAICLEAARRGSNIVLCDIDPQKNQANAKAVKKI